MADFFPWGHNYNQVNNSSALNGGLNTTGGLLNLQDTESPDMQNIDLDHFGAILKRNGYAALNTSTLSAGKAFNGLFWYEFNSAGAQTQYLVSAVNTKAYYMSGFNGTWIDVTGSVTITDGNHFDADNFLNNVYMTNGFDASIYWGGSGNFTTIEAFTSGAYTFVVSGITITPTAGATYTNNGNTYTVVASFLTDGAGTIVATSNASPQTSGTLTKTGGTGDGTVTFSLFTVNVNITSANFVKQWNNYLFMANVKVGTTTHPSRIYWSNPKDTTTWSATSFIDVSKDDGQIIRAIYPLSDRLVVFKDRAIYNILFTGDSDIPFILPGGGKSNSAVGCIGSYSVQAVENGLVFLAPDGFYYYDGNNSYKLSDRINVTVYGLNTTRFNQCVSCVQRKKNKVFFSLPSSSNTTNDTVLYWDYFLNAWGSYSGMAPSSMVTTYTSGVTENMYFGDYNGFSYHMDTGTDDYPSNVATAISAYYYTNWRNYGDLVNQKGIPQIQIYFDFNNAILTFSYSYDFNAGDQYTNTISTSTSGAVYGTAIWDTDVYSGSGGSSIRRDLDGRGRVVIFKFANANLGETFRIEGIGQDSNIETNV